MKNVGITGMMFQYIENVLSEIDICSTTRTGKTYSSIKNIDISQGSIIAPILFTILIHDLPKALSRTHMWHNMQIILLFGSTQLLESIRT